MARCSPRVAAAEGRLSVGERLAAKRRLIRPAARTRFDRRGGRHHAGGEPAPPAHAAIQERCRQASTPIPGLPPGPAATSARGPSQPTASIPMPNASRDGRVAAPGNIDQEHPGHQRRARGPEHDPGASGRAHLGPLDLAQRAEQVAVGLLGQGIARRRACPRLQLGLIGRRPPTPAIALPIPGKLAAESARIGNQVFVGRQDELPVHPPNPGIGVEPREFQTERTLRRPGPAEIVLQFNHEAASRRSALVRVLAGKRNRQPTVGQHSRLELDGRPRTRLCGPPRRRAEAAPPVPCDRSCPEIRPGPAGRWTSATTGPTARSTTVSCAASCWSRRTSKLRVLGRFGRRQPQRRWAVGCRGVIGRRPNALAAAMQSGRVRP